jgi:hypothetical protein
MTHLNVFLFAPAVIALIVMAAPGLQEVQAVAESSISGL